jgi:hypothetical protein
MYTYIIRKKKLIIEHNDKNYIPVIMGNNEDVKKYKNKKVLLLNNNDIHGYIKILKLVSNDNIEYDDLLKKFKMLNNTCLYFIQYDKLCEFDDSIKRSEINKILDIKIKINTDNFTLNEYSGTDLIKTIVNEINKKNILKNKEESESEEEEESESEEEEESDEETVNLGIPIMWKLCSKINKLIYNNEKMGRNTIKQHLCDCKDCEINNNNNNEMDLTKKFMFSKSNNNINKIIDCYERCIDYKDNENKINAFKSDDEIGLIYDDNDTYGEIIIII